MNKHTKSLSLSLVIHTLLLLSLFSFYKYFFSSSEPAQKEEKKICVNLASIKQDKAVQQVEQKVQKSKPPSEKIVKKAVKKNTKIKKETPPKKEIIKKEAKIMEKPVESTEFVKPLNPVIEEKPNIEKKTEATKKKEVTEKKIDTKQTIQKKMSDEDLYIKDNLAQIAQLIKENLYYPRVARKRGIQGTVTVRFMLLQDATVTQITTISSSSGILTRAAIKTIAELSGKFPKPKTDIMLSVPIRYSLH